MPRDIADGSTQRFPLALISGQPGTRLHSQFDNGELSKAGKVAGREPILLNPDDAAKRGIADGDIVELFNDRGRCLAGARITADVMAGVAFLWTSQSPASHSAYIEIQKFDGDAGPVRVHGPPDFMETASE